ncbi:PHD finger transcription factor [Rhynchospora pubera]|uniref:PHD finger transcription factor n=1 Tax=Rhynchospora pubera TaxID=906938 RepID=A0AAV8CDV0_9POAL|nr:PHD finger transcription factor [Rhynchospora pubera]
MASELDVKFREKLVLGERVEVLLLEEGLQGSWHSGMVIDMKPRQRTVMFNYLLETEQPQSPNLVETVRVSSALDGILSTKLFSQPSTRNNIRPYACRLPLQPSEATYGICVDVCTDNVHWEGIITDYTNDHTAQIMQKNVFYPDLGIDEPVLLQNLSLSSDWDEITGEWTPRGKWKFLEALEANQLERGSLCMTLQQLWHMARSQTYFITKLGGWTCGTRNEWLSVVLNLMHHLPHLRTSASVQSGTVSGSVSDFVEAYRDMKSSLPGISCKSLKEKSDIARSHLKSLGWKFMKTRGGTKYYVSTDGSRYESFIKACEGYLSEKAELSLERDIPEETSGFHTSVLTETSSAKTHHTFSYQGSELASQQGKSKKRKCRDAANLIKVREKLANSKGNSNSYHETESNSPRPPCAKTLLSLLIDKNLVMPRTKVSYQHQHFHKDGVITCNSIRCICCNKIFSATSFELHARGATAGKPLKNIYLRDGRSLLQCLLEAIETGILGIPFGTCLKASEDPICDSDVICSACHQDGLLAECCNCPSAFHPSCVDLKRTPDWYWCPLCCCRVCGSGDYTPNSNDSCDKSVVVCCEQCEGRFHVGCIKDGCQGLHGLGCSLTETWFCSSRCCEVARMLQSLVGRKITTSDKGLTWTLLKYSTLALGHTAIWEPELMAEQFSKLYLATEVLNECFMPMIEPRTNSDLISDIIFNRESNLCRINFKGFYTIIMEKGDEIVGVATLRVHGDKVAELPLVCTRSCYRRQGMCRRLITELEQLLRRLKVKKLILPSVSQHVNTWTNSFKFNVIKEEELLNLVRHNVLTFPGSLLLEKELCSI